MTHHLFKHIYLNSHGQALIAQVKKDRKDTNVLDEASSASSLSGSDTELDGDGKDEGNVVQKSSEASPGTPTKKAVTPLEETPTKKRDRKSPAKASADAPTNADR